MKPVVKKEKREYINGGMMEITASGQNGAIIPQWHICLSEGGILCEGSSKDIDDAERTALQLADSLETIFGLKRAK